MNSHITEEKHTKNDPFLNNKGREECVYSLWAFYHISTPQGKVFLLDGKIKSFCAIKGSRMMFFSAVFRVLI